jgi:hypothetical protein
MSALNFARWLVRGAFVGAVAAASIPEPIRAADAALPIRTSRVDRVAGYEVRYPAGRHRHGCPDGYSCYALYGAYGPYGGPAFWGAYSGSFR